MKTITITLYQCEICEEKYDSPDAAEKCENSHNLPIEITGYRYLYGCENNTFPTIIIVKTNNEKEAIYRFCNERSELDDY